MTVDVSDPPAAPPPARNAAVRDLADEARRRMESESSYDGLEGLEPLGLDDLHSYNRRGQ